MNLLSDIKELNADLERKMTIEEFFQFLDEYWEVFGPKPTEREHSFGIQENFLI